MDLLQFEMDDETRQIFLKNDVSRPQGGDRKKESGEYKPPNRKDKRKEARYKNSTEAKIKNNSREIREARIKRQYEKREMAEKQRRKKRTRIARENGEGFRGRFDAAVQMVKVFMKKENLKDMGLEIVIVMAALVVMMVVVWIGATQQRYR